LQGELTVTYADETEEVVRIGGLDGRLNKLIEEIAR
jgi:hypothetical protein